MGTVTVKGWGMTGTRREAYAAEKTDEVFEGKPVVRTWRSGEGDDAFGALCQFFRADAYRGKRVRFSAALRTVDVTGNAALCLRVDGPTKGNVIAFDNMDNRPLIRGTTDWSRHACVLDVAPEAVAIFFSNILAGRGELFWADVRFEVVDASVPVTDMQGARALPEGPVNLDFTQE